MIAGIYDIHGRCPIVQRFTIPSCKLVERQCANNVFG